MCRARLLSQLAPLLLTLAAAGRAAGHSIKIGPGPFSGGDASFDILNSPCPVSLRPLCCTCSSRAPGTVQPGVVTIGIVGYPVRARHARVAPDGSCV
jgi:hypothetical protein